MIFFFEVVLFCFVLFDDQSLKLCEKILMGLQLGLLVYIYICRYVMSLMFVVCVCLCGFVAITAGSWVLAFIQSVFKG